MVDGYKKLIWQVAVKPTAPQFLQTDQGKEFHNSTFKNMLANFKVCWYFTYSTKKANYVERWNRTIKNKIWKEFSVQGSYRWIDILPRLVANYNHNYIVQ